MANEDQSDHRIGSAAHMDGQHAHHARRDTQEQGAPPSNTAPSNCITDPTRPRILRSGVDSLYLSYTGKIAPDVEEALVRLKDLAQDSAPEIRNGARFILSGHWFEVSDHGHKRFPFVLSDNWYQLQISASKARVMPMVYAKLSSELLTKSGVKQPLAELGTLVALLGQVAGEPSISRVDLCVDFLPGISLESITPDAWVTRADGYATYFEHRKLSGFAIGQGGQLSARLYDKTLEIETESKKYYLHDIWRAAGWDGKEPVWRMEFQFRREVLRELGIGHVGELLERSGGVWGYATNDWLRLTTPSPTDSTQSRWPNHPLWEVLAAATWEDSATEPLTRTRKERMPSPEFLFVNGLGAVTSFMAMAGIDDVVEGVGAWLEAAEAYHAERGHEAGEDLQSYALIKAEEKARKYNTVIERERSQVLMVDDGEDEV